MKRTKAENVFRPAACGTRRSTSLGPLGGGTNVGGGGDPARLDDPLVEPEERLDPAPAVTALVDPAARRVGATLPRLGRTLLVEGERGGGGDATCTVGAGGTGGSATGGGAGGGGRVGGGGRTGGGGNGDGGSGTVTVGTETPASAC